MIPEDVEAYVEVSRTLDMPVAGGEAEFARFGFGWLLAERAVDIVHADLTATGGYTEGQRIGALASAWGVRYLPHGGQYRWADRQPAVCGGPATRHRIAIPAGAHLRVRQDS